MGNNAGIKVCSKPQAKKYKCVLYFFLNLINLDTSKSVQGEIKKRVEKMGNHAYGHYQGKEIYIYRKN